MSEDFEYSPEALDSRKLLLEVDAVIYVEGVDDKLFWPKIFNSFSDKVFIFEDVGGKPELLKKLKILRENNSNFIIAIDLDYSYFIEEGFGHSNVITTYGHSIENTLIQKQSVIEIVENSSDIDREKLIKRYEEFCENINMIVDRLLHVDIFCCEQDIKSVIGKNIAKYAKSDKTYCVCEEKINKFKSEVCIPDEIIYKRDLVRTLSKLHLSPLDLVNGHFLFSSLLRFVVFNSEGFRERFNFTSDSLLTTLLLNFKSIFNDTHPHYNYYEIEILKIESIIESFC